MSLLEELDPFSNEALFKSLSCVLLGRKLSSGSTRDVYECYIDSSLVVKVAKNFNGIQANHQEFSIWGSVLGWKDELEFVRDSFVPARVISEDGKVLLMDKAEPIHEDQMPEKVLNCLTDLKAENFGIHAGQVKCLDYGLHLIHEKGITKRMVKRDKKFWK